MADREIYPRTPLALVVAEIRHPAALPLSDSARSQLKTRLAPLFPLAKPVQQLTVTPTQTAVSTNVRFMSRDRTSSVTFRDDVIVVETTRYERRRVLRNMLREAVLARQETAPVDGVERLGIRYVNEVRVPGLESPREWAGWIAPALTCPLALTTVNGLETQAWQGVSVLGDAQYGVVVRHGVFDGYAVDPVGDLQRAAPPPGPFFLIDLDCYWAPSGETPPLEWDLIDSHFDQASLAAYDLFEQLITDKLREEVLRHDG
jgi:uncharacterized protein (TIGR04255 family)